MSKPFGTDIPSSTSAGLRVDAIRLVSAFANGTYTDQDALQASAMLRNLLEEIERLREFERSAALTLPGVYYMDPPDGGDVSLLKQLQRSSIDAARYRLLRRKFAIISDGKGNAEFCPINLPRPTYIAPNTAIELDTALDRERLGMDGAERPPTPVDAAIDAAMKEEK